MTAPTELLRPIIGIENRTAQEVFDIMCDRFRALPASEAGWRPIETVPEDDTLFLAYCPPDDEFPDGRTMIWKGSIFAYQKKPTPRHLQFPATHWMPLPSAPDRRPA